jgi:hypothetical protein
MSLKKEVTNSHEFGLLIGIMLVIWESIKNFPQIETNKITDDLFDEFADKNEGFIKFFSEEESEKDQNQLAQEQVDSYRQKYLFAYLHGEITLDEENKFTFDIHSRSRIIFHIKHILDCIDYVLNT